MIAIQKKHLASAALSSLLLAACGGGGGGESMPDTLAGGSAGTDTATTPATVQSPKFSDCFMLTPGVRYTMTDGTPVLNVEEPFEGQMRHGTVLFRSNGLRDVTTFQVVDDTAITLLGEYEYDMAGNNVYKDIYTNYSLPANLQLGQSHTINATETKSGPAGTSTNSFSETFTFLGFENLTLAGKTIPNVCRLREDSDPSATQKTHVWHARGYGLVRQAILTTEGQLVPGSLYQIATITTAP